MLLETRKFLLDEARSSPALLSDLAGLEEYVAESYDSRSFIELLQNADDAGSSRFVIKRFGQYLFVANDGRQFSQKDLESLCRSAASTKSRGNSIGYRGIGFKSVVGLAKTIYLISGELEVLFSKDKTALDIPQAARVPLIRIPHPIAKIELDAFSNSLNILKDKGFTTFFVFNDLLANAIDNEFSNFDPSSLLFLRNIKHLELHTDTETNITVCREALDSRFKSIKLASSEAISEWIITESNQVAIAFGMENDVIKKLDERSAVVHAFLPTLESTGLAIKIHGDISTDPSRTRVVLDERTILGIEEITTLVLDIIGDAISSKPIPYALGMFSALIPLSDPRLARFHKKSFKTVFFNSLEEKAKTRFENWFCRPKWINSVDFELMAQSLNIKVIPRQLDVLDGANSFFRFLNVKEVDFIKLLKSFSNVEFSIHGAVEIISELVARHTTKQIDIKDINVEWRIWQVNGKRLSLIDAKNSNLALDNDFKDLIVEKSVGESGIRRLITALTNQNTAAILLPEQAVPVKHIVAGNTLSTSKMPAFVVNPLSLKRWRGAEEQVLNILGSQGYLVEDVSRQNIGYDLLCTTKNGEEFYIEVKFVSAPNVPFTLTSNEEAVARQKGTNYKLAIVCQIGNFLEVAFIDNPVQQLNFTRQCRQWVWECSDYPYQPLRFPLE